MPGGTNYWTRRRVSRRTALRGAGVGIAGLAGAALIGCGGDDDTTVAGSGAGGLSRSDVTQATAAATTEAAAAGATAVPEDQIRIPSGFYSSPVPPTLAEQNPLVNGKYGGTLVDRYLDPPHMDINRTLSCTVYHTMNYTQNKITRGKTGALAHPFIVELEGDLAESWEATPDNTEFTFHLNKGVKTHNIDPTFGREYTSEDVKLSMERYQSGGVQKDVFGPVVSIETPDDYTVKLKLDQPLADFPTNLASWSFMWVKERLEQGDDAIAQERAVGTGPYLHEDWVKKERSVFTKHPDYFEEGLPFIDRLEMNVQGDAAAQRAAFQTGNFFSWSARDHDDALALLNQVDTMVYWRTPVSRGANTTGWHYQMTNPTFQDIRVRRALSLAFDRNEYDLAELAGDNANPNGAFSSPSMPWAFLFDEYPDARANGPWYQYDPAQARQLMQAAGYTEDAPLAIEEVGYYDRNRFPSSIMPGINDSLPEVDLSFRQVDNPTQVTLLSDRNFDQMIDIVWGPAGFSMDQWIYPWNHSKGGLNYNNIDDPDMDRVLEAQRAEVDLEAKKVLWQEFWDLLHDRMYDVYYPVGLARRAWHNNVLNYRGHGLMGPWVCYTSDQVRSMWIEDQFPGFNT